MAQWFLLFSYFLGSVPSAYIAGRLAGKQDIRRMGDRNVGAANAYREVGHMAGVFVFLADVAKGSLTVILARALNLSELTTLASGLLVVIGHNWPVFLRFRGGRGVSATIGVMFTLLPWAMLLLAVPGAIAFARTRSVTFACGVIFAPLPLVTWLLGASPLLIVYSATLPCLVGLTHYLTTRRLPARAG